MEEGLSYLDDSDVKETVIAVWNEFGKRTAYDLVELTHQQKPWEDAYLSGTKITNISIKNYFQSTF